MVDVHSSEQRHFNMSRIRSRDTTPELLLRRGLHKRGLRFRLHQSDLPGCPDLVFAKHDVAVFVHGCFWHAHDCPKFKWPATRRDFWRSKLLKTREHDTFVNTRLVELGWRVLTVWECALTGPHRIRIDNLLDQCEAFIVQSKTRQHEISGI